MSLPSCHPGQPGASLQPVSRGLGFAGPAADQRRSRGPAVTSLGLARVSHEPGRSGLLDEDIVTWSHWCRWSVVIPASLGPLPATPATIHLLSCPLPPHPTHLSTAI